jgi:transcription antitermination factor NusG
MDIAASQWPRIRAFPLVLGVLGVGGRPVALLPGELERMRAEDGSSVPHVTSVPTNRGLVPGQTVRIAEGPFRDWVVKVEHISRRGARASLNFLCAQHEIDLPLEWLEAA